MNINIEFKPSGELQPIIIESNDNGFGENTDA